MPPASESAELRQYVDILLDQGLTRGLIGPREGERIWDRHITNSLALLKFIPGSASVVDVGSGAGLPGIPVAIARPDVQMTLLEPMLRRTTFLEETVAELGLTPRVVVVRGRAEDHRAKYDVVIARALAPLDRLLGWCLPLLRARGQLLALKGRSADNEVAAAAASLRQARRTADVLEVRAAPDAEPTRVIRVR